MLSGRKIRTKYFEHWLSSQDLPQPIPPGELKELVIRLKDGDDRVIDTIIEGHIRLATSIAGRYLWKHPLRVDDIVSAALVGVTQAVHWARERLKDYNITPYITTTVHRHISDFLEKDQLIHVGRQYIRSRGGYQAFSEIDPKIFKFARPFTVDTGDEENPREEVDPSLAVEDSTAAMDLAEAIEYLQLSEDDCTILIMKSEGYTTHEIGAAIGKNFRTVSWRFNQIKGRCIKLKEMFV
jgi:RNA polymerase sigma factor (sigma-70 family)